MAPDPPRLSTTARTVLGLLSLRSMTGYELTRQAQRGFVHFWPKADSVLYDQPRRLEQLGLVTRTVEHHAGRDRNRYTITDAGRAEVRRWLASDPVEVGLELEPLVRLVFADQGTLDDAGAAIESLRAWATRRLVDGLEVTEPYDTGAGDFPARTHLNILSSNLLGDLYTAVLEWADRASTEVGRWASTVDPGPDSRTHQMYAEGRDRALAALERHGSRPGPPTSG